MVERQAGGEGEGEQGQEGGRGDERLHGDGGGEVGCVGIPAQGVGPVLFSRRGRKGFGWRGGRLRLRLRLEVGLELEL